MDPDTARALIARWLIEAYRAETNAPDDMIAMLAKVAGIEMGTDDEDD